MSSIPITSITCGGCRASRRGSRSALEPSNESQARERRRLWPAGDGVMAERWEPAGRDVLFLAGVDWRYLKRERPGEPWPIRESTSSSTFGMPTRARSSIVTSRRGRSGSASARKSPMQSPPPGGPNGPVLTIPNGIDVTPFDSAGGGSPAGFDERGARPVTIVGYKSPELAGTLSERLDSQRTSSTCWFANSSTGARSSHLLARAGSPSACPANERASICPRSKPWLRAASW